MNKLMQVLGYKFKNQELLSLALTHRSAGSNNNERLEFLGDSIINFIIAAELIARFPKADEGQLTRMRAELVCADMLITIAKQFTLGEHVILGLGEQRSGGHQRGSILADALEAIVGAIYLDCNMDVNIVKNTVLNWYVDKFEIFSGKKPGKKDPKTVLQELLQAKKLPLPEYELVKTVGEPHDQTFYVLCHIKLLKGPVQGVGNSRRKAEQIAAEQVLNKLNAK